MDKVDKLSELILGNPKTDDLPDWVGVVIVGLWVMVMFC